MTAIEFQEKYKFNTNENAIFTGKEIKKDAVDCIQNAKDFAKFDKESGGTVIEEGKACFTRYQLSVFVNKFATRRGDTFPLSDEVNYYLILDTRNDPQIKAIKEE